MFLEEKTYFKPIKIKTPKKKRGSPLILAEHAVPFEIKDISKNFDKYFEESLK